MLLCRSSTIGIAGDDDDALAPCNPYDGLGDGRLGEADLEVGIFRYVVLTGPTSGNIADDGRGTSLLFGSPAPWTMSGTDRAYGSSLFPLEGFGLISLLTLGGEGVRIDNDLLGIGVFGA